MLDRDLKRPQVEGRSRQSTKLAITLFLLAFVIVTGIAAFESRNVWWEKYLNVVR